MDGEWGGGLCAMQLVIFKRAARRAVRIDSQATGRPANLIRGRRKSLR